MVAQRWYLLGMPPGRQTGRPSTTASTDRRCRRRPSDVFISAHRRARAPSLLLPRARACIMLSQTSVRVTCLYRIYVYAYANRQCTIIIIINVIVIAPRQAASNLFALCADEYRLSTEEADADLCKSAIFQEMHFYFLMFFDKATEILTVLVFFFLSFFLRHWEHITIRVTLILF